MGTLPEGRNATTKEDRGFCNARLLEEATPRRLESKEGNFKNRLHWGSRQKYHSTILKNPRRGQREGEQNSEGGQSFHHSIQDGKKEQSTSEGKELVRKKTYNSNRTFCNPQKTAGDKRPVFLKDRLHNPGEKKA